MVSHITENNIDKLKRQFLALDEEGSCDLSVSKLRSLLKDPNLKMTEENIRGMIEALDLDKNGAIDSIEFLILLSNRKDNEFKELVQKAITFRSPIRKAFKEFDKNGDGYITKKEFRTVMRRGQGMVSDAQLDTMVKDAARDGDGKINYDEFVLVITNKLLMYNLYGAF